MFSSPTRSSVAGCSTARESGVANYPLTTAEALLRSARHNALHHRREESSVLVDAKVYARHGRELMG